MTMFGAVSGRIGYPNLGPGRTFDTTQALLPGTILHTQDPFWGAGEMIYCTASATIGMYALCTIVPTWDATNLRWDFVATPCPNTANLGQSAGVAQTPATVGQKLFVKIFGVTPVNSNAAVATDTAFAVAAVGQAGALAAGKQVLNARVCGASSTTVAKSCTGVSGTKTLTISNSDAGGWFIGAYLSGTGIGAGAKITDISPDGSTVTVDVAHTAQIAGAVTATYNNSTIYYNVVMLDRPFMQGQIT
jgi:hypothetical protein